MGPRFKRRNLPLLMLQARERVIGNFRPLLNANGITEQQWRIVRVLCEAEPLEPHEIGRLCGLTSASLAGVLSRMEDIGLVTRVRLKTDQRRLKVSLTPHSRALAARLAPQIEVIYRRIERRLGTALFRQLLASLDEVIEKLPE